MSRVYFHFEDGHEAELAGAERGWCDHLSSSVLAGLLGTNVDSWQRVYDLLDGPKLQIRPEYRFHDLQLALDPSGFNKVTIFGQPLWHLYLNTAMALGGDAIRLATRIHAQCELHCYMEEEDRRWIAEKIRDARQPHLPGQHGLGAGRRRAG